MPYSRTPSEAANHIDRARTPEVVEHASTRPGGALCAAAVVAAGELGGDVGGVSGRPFDEHAASAPAHAITTSQRTSDRVIDNLLEISLVESIVGV